MIWMLVIYRCGRKTLSRDIYSPGTWSKVTPWDFRLRATGLRADRIQVSFHMKRTDNPHEDLADANILPHHPSAVSAPAK